MEHVPKRRAVMSDHHVYKKVELVGSSRTTIEDAIENALVTASESLELMDWFEVTETRGHIENGKVGHYQVTLKVGFRISGS
tara:strand:+ start:260 stop:505 length:246 start_codon:yes stop_codon:yes gene_type:complete